MQKNRISDRLRSSAVNLHAGMCDKRSDVDCVPVRREAAEYVSDIRDRCWCHEIFSGGSESAHVLLGAAAAARCTVSHGREDSWILVT